MTEREFYFLLAGIVLGILTVLTHQHERREKKRRQDLVARRDQRVVIDFPRSRSKQ